MRGTEELGADRLGGGKAGSWGLRHTTWAGVCGERGPGKTFWGPVAKGPMSAKVLEELCSVACVLWSEDPPWRRGVRKACFPKRWWVFRVEITEGSPQWAELTGELSRRPWWGVTDAGLRPWARPWNAGEGREPPKGCDFERSRQFYLNTKKAQRPQLTSGSHQSQSTCLHWEGHAVTDHREWRGCFHLCCGRWKLPARGAVSDSADKCDAQSQQRPRAKNSR